jgi:CBS domain containing-hemolysin-like protein
MTLVLVLGAAVTLLLSAWLRAAGTAVTRVPRADALRDAAEEVAGAEAVATMLEDREIIVPAVGVVGSALLIVSAVLGVTAVVGGHSGTDAVWRALLVGFVVFLLGDLIPRRMGRVGSRRIAYRSAWALSLSVKLGGWANDLISDPEVEAESEETEEEEDETDEQERELIDSVLEFSETLVREAMTPRPDMVTIPANATIEELVLLSTDQGFSRIPVTNNGDVVGLVILKDLLPMYADGKQPNSIEEIMRVVDFVPETKLAATLLAEMRASHVHQKIVVDEYGDITGLITIEDLLEELVGEIADETDEDEVLLVSIGPEQWAVDARLSVEDLADELDVELPDEEWDTVGGLVLGIAERVPEEGEEFQVGALRFTVKRMQGRRVADLTVVREPSPESV